MIFYLFAVSYFFSTLQTVAAEPTSSPLLAGRIFSDFYVPNQESGNTPFRQISTSLWLQTEPKLNEHSSAIAIFSADQIDTNQSGTSLKTTLREGYVNYANAGFEFRIGRQIIPWGKSDVINPTDFLSAKDLTFLNSDEEVRRLGATSLVTSLTPSQGNSPLTLTAVWTPVFPQTKLLISPNAIPTNVTLASSSLLPPATLANSETALKISLNESSWDTSLLYFNGWNHMPEYAITSITGVFPALNVSIAPTFHRIHAVGLDSSTTWGKWIWRLEGAYIWTDNDSGKNALIQPTHWDSVLGVERSFWTDFRFQLQIVTRVIPSYTDPDFMGGPDPATTFVNRQIAGVNALLLNYQEPNRTGATFRLSYTNEQNGIDTELFIIGQFIGADYLIRPKFSYSWTDALKTSLGMDYYGGPEDRPLGALRAYNSVFTETKYSF